MKLRKPRSGLKEWRTMELRFRREWINDERTQRVLQQKWAIHSGDQDDEQITYEWRDVPMEDDE